MLNKKGIEEEGTRFSTQNITLIIVFLILVVIAILIIAPRIMSETQNGVMLNFGRHILDLIGVE